MTGDFYLKIFKTIMYIKILLYYNDKTLEIMRHDFFGTK